MTGIPEPLPFILPLDHPAATLELVGGKGASLARLAAAGLPVPPGFHVTTAAYARFVEANALQAPIAEASRQATPDDPASLEQASASIAALFRQGAMPDEIAAAIRGAYARLEDGAGAVAVRSSATAEDLPDLSFAGQQETYLNVRGEPALLEAVQRCWASLWTARALGYRARNAIPADRVRLAVVVQALVPADAAGVLFTANPLTGSRGEMLINAAWGLGDALVSGELTPDSLVVDKARRTVLRQQVSDKATMTVAAPVGGTREEPVPADRRRQPVLSREHVAELARLGERIEALYGQPMDVEWAVRDGRLFVLQARPITALPEPGRAATGADASADPWALPNPKGRYMRGSALELLPEPLSPLFATLGLPAWSRALNAFAREVRLGGFLPDEMLTTINGYGYYDMSLTPAQTIRMLGAVLGTLALFPRLLRTARARWRAARARYQELVARRRATDVAAAPAEDLLDGAAELADEAARYYVSIQTGVLPGAYVSETAFTTAYERLYRHRRRGAPPALTFLLGYTSTPIQAEFSLYDLAQWVRAQPELTAVLAEMTSAAFTGAHQAHLDGTSQGGAWPAFWRRMDEHLARFGHGIFDLDFAKPVPADDPSSLLEPLRFFASGQAPDPRIRQAAAAAAREQATRELMAQRAGPRRRLIARLLRGAQEFVVMREDGLADVGLGWPLLRRMLRELGRRLAERQAIAEPDDVFWLTLDELRHAARALDRGQVPTDMRPVAAERRATWERQRAQTPPIALPRRGGTRFLGVDIARFMPARSDQAASAVLRGMGGSPGHVTGTARVIHGPGEFVQMRRGDVLVARITTPAWTPLFALAAGVVTDIGGPLSHSSIVAREYHIPAVLGTGVATERLRSGQRVRVDGDAGTVTVL